MRSGPKTAVSNIQPYSAKCFNRKTLRRHSAETHCAAVAANHTHSYTLFGQLQDGQSQSQREEERGTEMEDEEYRIYGVSNRIRRFSLIKRATRKCLSSHIRAISRNLSLKFNLMLSGKCKSMCSSARQIGRIWLVSFLSSTLFSAYTPPGLLMCR